MGVDVGISTPHGSIVGWITLRCLAVYTCNCLQPYELEVWEWVVKRRIFNPFSEFPWWVWFLPDFL